jgi:protein-tyrosine phosphatase
MSGPSLNEDLRRRAVRVDGTFNFRDIGGYLTNDGGITRWGRLFRSDALHVASPAARDALSALGLRTIIDLRTEKERTTHPNAFAEVAPIVEACPVIEDTAFDPVPISLAEVYDHFVDVRGAALTRAVQALCAPEALPAVVHCTAGKDRTGVVTALVLSSLGVADDTVAEDFAATELFMTDEFVAVLTDVQAVSATSPLLGASSEVMLGLLDRIEQQWGGALAFLEAHGLQHDAHDRLRAQLVDYSG